MCAVLLAVAAQADASPPSLLIAVEDDWPPYSERGADGAPQGLAPQLAREAFRRQGVLVSFVLVPFARCLMLARVGRVAGCLSATITDDNRGQFWWHPTPMFTEELAIFSLAAADAGLSLRDLAGRRVGITQDYTYPSAFMRDSKIIKSVAHSDDDLIRMLLARRVDYVLMNTRPVSCVSAATPPPPAAFARWGASARMAFGWLSPRRGPRAVRTRRNSRPA
ncbi:transporter substrate-binding domain-containing protein [Chromobacterium haemolyticum]|nr:transporter substrate-binding domain-containing protein [Chromobacterium haemolyticum]